MKGSCCKNLAQLPPVLLGHSLRDKLEHSLKDKLEQPRMDKLEQTQLVDTAHGQVLLSELHIEPNTLVAEVQVDKQVESVEEGWMPSRVEQHKEQLW